MPRWVGIGLEILGPDRKLHIIFLAMSQANGLVHVGESLAWLGVLGCGCGLYEGREYPGDSLTLRVESALAADRIPIPRNQRVVSGSISPHGKSEA